MKKVLKRTLIGAGVVVLGGLAWGTNYLFHYALDPGEKEFLAPAEASGNGQSTAIKVNLEPTKTLTMKAAGADYQLKAYYYRHPDTDQTAHEPRRVMFIAHGYSSKAKDMQQYIEMFYQLGYDVVAPDARAHGASQGSYIGFGWPERLDYVKWMKKVNQMYDDKVTLGLYGISMGAATVMMTAGEKLPDNVKVIIEDCGYDSTANELSYQLKAMFHLPEYPLIPLASAEAKVRAGYSFYESSAVQQLKKNKRPMLFIHGDADKFVPYSMVKKVYQATKGPKELYTVKGAAHAQSYELNPAQYKKVVSTFLDKYWT